jgi:hypothetical protein
MLSALPMIPRMLRKRRVFLRSRARLNPRQIRRMLLSNRISLKELSQQST